MMKLPSQNPLFFSHPSLEGEFNRSLLKILSETNWLWQELTVEKDPQENVHINFQKEWSRLHYHGLAKFFSEIAYYLAYLQALTSISEVTSNTILFHGSNIALRMVACSDRMGFFLYEHFQIAAPEKVYFGTTTNEILKTDAINEPDKSLVRQMRKQFDKTSALRNWRHEYSHRHGEYFRNEESKDIAMEYFPWDKSDKATISKELVVVLFESFQKLKSAMRLASKLVT
jgi:hypothetical protein